MHRRVSWPIMGALAGLFASAHAAPQKATFASDVATVQWPLADLDPALPENWKDFEFLVIEFRAASSQRARKMRQRCSDTATLCVGVAQTMNCFRCS